MFTQNVQSSNELSEAVQLLCVKGSEPLQVSWTHWMMVHDHWFIYCYSKSIVLSSCWVHKLKYAMVSTSVAKHVLLLSDTSRRKAAITLIALQPLLLKRHFFLFLLKRHFFLFSLLRQFRGWLAFFGSWCPVCFHLEWSCWRRTRLYESSARLWYWRRQLLVHE